MPLVAAIVVKEFQTWLRGRLTFAIFTLLVLFLSILLFLFGLLVLAPDANAAPALFSTTSTTTSFNLLVANRALFLFGAVGLCTLLAAAVVTPAVAASAFAVERDRGTFDLLLLQGPGTSHIVLGKVIAAYLFSLLLLLVALPLFAPAWSYGGVQGHQVTSFLTVLLASTLAFAAIGVFCGVLFRTTLPAALLAQAVTLTFLFGTIGAHLAVTAFGGGDALKPLLWLNPFLALLSTGGTVVEALVRQAPPILRPILSLPSVAWVPGYLAPPWVLSSIVWTVIAALLVWASSILVDPCHPLRRGRA